MTQIVHHATKRFWKDYDRLPPSVQNIADKNFQLLKLDPFHPSLHFKKIGEYWSVRAGLEYRALGKRHGSVMIWFWIGHHGQYDRLIS